MHTVAGVTAKAITVVGVDMVVVTTFTEVQPLGSVKVYEIVWVPAPARVGKKVPKEMPWPPNVPPFGLAESGTP